MLVGAAALAGHAAPAEPLAQEVSSDLHVCAALLSKVMPRPETRHGPALTIPITKYMQNVVSS